MKAESKKKVDLVLKKRNLKLWKELAGIWKNKKIPDPVKWQRKIRNEWP